jgi:glycosyltransferase involved in cell wall biosynthesis
VATPAELTHPPLAGKPRLLLGALSAFFPVHDEEANVVAVAEGLLDVLPRVAAVWELVIVDDGSRDGTGPLAQELARARAGVRVVRHSTRRGYGAAIRSGLAAARYDHVFYTDGDRQFDPADLNRLVPHLAHADVIAGYRERRADHLGRRLNTYAWNLLVRALFRLPVRDVDCAFKLIRRSVLAEVTLAADGAMISTELLARVCQRGHRIVEVPVRHFPRPAGRPSGARPAVVARAFVELVRLRAALHSPARTRRLTPAPVLRSVRAGAPSTPS